MLQLAPLPRSGGYLLAGLVPGGRGGGRQSACLRPSVEHCRWPLSCGARGCEARGSGVVDSEGGVGADNRSRGGTVNTMDAINDWGAAGASGADILIQALPYIRKYAR